MYTQDNSGYYAYQISNQKKRIYAKKKRARRRRIKLALSASIFTLTLTTAAGWYILKNHSALFETFSVTTDAAPAPDTGAGENDSLRQSETAPAGGSMTQNASASSEIQSEGQRTDSADTDGTFHIASISDEWNLILVNPWNPLPDDYNVQLTDMSGGHAIDSRCYPYLQEMMDDCRAAGLNPTICSSYRTQEKQETLFQERIDELTAQGYSLKEARSKAATSVAFPGTSEHQAGLAVDIVDQNHQVLDYTQEYTMVQQWLMANSWKYGFILRYPNEKSSLTGIIYEPWHYRYVGIEAAREIYEKDICLEEYLAQQL